MAAFEPDDLESGAVQRVYHRAACKARQFRRHAATVIR
jgi:hypothetical protein